MTSVPPARVQRLLRRFPPTGLERTWYPNGGDERALLLWQYFRIHPDEPLPLRYAHGLAYVMEKIAITLHPDELLVGEVGLENVAVSRPSALKRAQSFWRARQDRFCRSFPWHAAERRAGRHGLSWKWTNRDGHAIPDFSRLVAVGLDGLIAAAQNSNVEEEGARGEVAEERRVFRQAMVVSLRALSAYIRRYADLAAEMARSESAPQRHRDLVEIAGRCAWLAGHPPRTFHEALQLVWFAHLGIKLDDGGVGHSFGRFDQYLYSFYQADLQAGRLDEDSAREWLALFWLKVNREGDDIAHLSLGGQTTGGQDAANDLTRLCLCVEGWISRKQPNLSTRVHARTPDWLWREIAETILRGAGHPAIFNDDVIIPGLLDYGFPPEEAYDFAPVGCVETFLPGLGAPWTDAYLNLAKCLELALNNGRDLVRDQRIGPASGDPRGFGGFDDLFAAYETQVEAALNDLLSAKDDYDRRLSWHAPEPLNSAFIRDCLERGQDATGGGARYLLTGLYGVGLGTTVDSLAALAELVYGQGQVPIDELLAALRADFAGQEGLRQMCLQRAPKYGNDDERADRIAVRAIESFGKQVRRYSDEAWQACLIQNPQAVRRAYHYAMFGSVLSHTSMGALTAASANGRRAGETLSDGGSPSQGCSRRGVTAALRSLAKASYRLAPGGAAINLRLAPAHFEGPEGIDRLVALLKTYVELGGEQLQVNLVSAETLRQAQANPSAYRDLVVRVAGFTAYFVSLTPELQRELILRTE